MIYNLDLEQRIIGGIIIAGGTMAQSEAFEFLQAEDFYANDHKRIYSCFMAIRASGKTVDADNVTIEVDDDLFAYTMEQWKNTSGATDLGGWCKELRQYRQIRETQERVNQINEVMFSSGSVPEKLQQIESMFSADLGFHYGADGAKHIRDCSNNYLDELEKRWSSPESVVFSTGVHDLDEIMNGGYEVGLHAIAARPKMGKTELMVKMINHFSKRGPVFVGSLEMEDKQMVHRMISQLGRLDKSSIYSNFKDSQNRESDEAALNNAFYQLSQTDIYIDDRYDLSVSKIWRESRKIQKKHGQLSGIFVDYLTLLESDQKFERRDLAVGHMTRSLKAMSKEFGCPVIMLLQLNRGLESRQDKRPMPSDSRDSGSIEQDVDSWIGLYRDSVYNEDSHWKQITEVILRLNRHGGTGTAYQLLTGHGFIDVDQEQVARLVHAEQSKPQNYSKNTSDF